MLYQTVNIICQQLAYYISSNIETNPLEYFFVYEVVTQKGGHCFHQKEMSLKRLMDFASGDDKVGSTLKIHTH